MAMRPKLWSLSGLAVEFGRNVRTVGKALGSTPPDGQVAGHDAWRMETALAAWRKYEKGGEPE